MEILELTVTACLHLLRGTPPDFRFPAFGSGVMIKYKNRYFICSVEHFTNVENTSVGIVTGLSKDGEAQIYQLPSFSYIDQFEFEETPDAEDLEYILTSGKSGKSLDIAFQELPLLKNIYQAEKNISLDELGNLHIKQGGKSYLIVDEEYEIDTTQLCSFFGRIRPNVSAKLVDFEEYLYYGLPIVGVTDNFIKLDMGGALMDYSRFRGCSGAPIIDTNGRLIAIVTHGSPDPNEPYLFGFRFDKIKKWIDLTYLNPHIVSPTTNN